MKSFLDVEGLYTPGLRFAFTNITDEDFTSHWNKIPITVKPRETIELSDITPLPGISMGHNLAVKMTSELVDKIMINNAKLDEIAKNQPYYRSPQASSLGVPGARKIWEDQILREMGQEEESPAMKMMREQLKQELLGNVEMQPSKESVTSNISAGIMGGKMVGEFSDIDANPSNINVINQEAKTKPIKNEIIKATTKSRK